MTNFQSNLSKVNFINAKDIASVVDFLIEEWKTKNHYQIVHFMYYASLELLRNNQTYATALQKANYVLVDGIGMQLYFKMALNKKMSNLNGTDLSPILIQKLVEQNHKIVFYGTTEAQIEACNNNLKNQYNKNILSYYQNGYTPLDWTKVEQNSVLFVGKGTPIQEIWTEENLNHIKEKNIFVITIGGYFDFLSGLYIRAPKWVRFLKLEWLWRTLLHPHRHYQKRLRDTTIIFRPWLDKIFRNHRHFNIKEI